MLETVLLNEVCKFIVYTGLLINADEQRFDIYFKLRKNIYLAYYVQKLTFRIHKYWTSPVGTQIHF